MIKVEQNLLILDSTLSKEDALAINEFIEITKKQLVQEITNMLWIHHHITAAKLVDEVYNG